jgi:hypothetical protein
MLLDTLTLERVRTMQKHVTKQRVDREVDKLCALRKAQVLKLARKHYPYANFDASEKPEMISMVLEARFGRKALMLV